MNTDIVKKYNTPGCVGPISHILKQHFENVAAYKNENNV